MRSIVFSLITTACLLTFAFVATKVTSNALGFTLVALVTIVLGVLMPVLSTSKRAKELVTQESTNMEQTHA